MRSSSLELVRLQNMIGLSRKRRYWRFISCYFCSPVRTTLWEEKSPNTIHCVTFLKNSCFATVLTSPFAFSSSGGRSGRVSDSLGWFRYAWVPPPKFLQWPGCQYWVSESLCTESRVWCLKQVTKEVHRWVFCAESSPPVLQQEEERWEGIRALWQTVMWALSPSCTQSSLT